jgi:CubicO group peptidase (beta-lactamase class C family)
MWTGRLWKRRRSQLSEAIHGTVAPGLEGVRRAFAQNFAEGLEVGAAFSAWRGREKLVDLWGGFADRGSARPWREDTLQLIYSGSKGLTAICMLMLIDRGQIALNDSVNRHWPAFGKPEILVRHILSHTSRLAGIDEPTTWEDVLDDQLMARKLERQLPFSDPRAGLTYHPMTYGWLCGELLRQVDGRSLGRFFAEEIARPLDLDIWFGLPAEHETRVATLEGDGVWGYANKNLVIPNQEQRAADSLQTAIWYNPPLFGPDFAKWNARSLHAAEMPGAGAIGAARSIASLYAILASGGAPLIRSETLKLGAQVLSDGWDALNDEHRRFGIGFALQTETSQFGPPADGFGHGGAGGSVHGAWPGHGIGFSYSMNRLIDGEDLRATRLPAALYASVRA